RLRVHPDHLDAEVLREGAHDLVALTEAQQPVIDEHAHQLPADGPVQQGGDHRGVDSAGQPEQYPGATDPGADALDRVLDDVTHAPKRIAAADLAYETLEQAGALH